MEMKKMGEMRCKGGVGGIGKGEMVREIEGVGG